MTHVFQKEIQDFLNLVQLRNPNEPEFHQAVSEFAHSIIPFTYKNPKYQQSNLLLRLTEPDRVISFRTCWEDDQGNVQVNRGYRVQFNNAIGPYKGGIRFHPSVNLSVLKFLGFEQTLKNSLTTLPLGGAKGGADFDPKGKSDHEVMRFCQAYMMELYRHIGKDRDVPAGDIGVGGREVSYLFGQYKRMNGEFSGVLTGKGLSFGGSQIRTEATGYGCVYLVCNALQHHGESLEGKRVAISGSGNVAQYAAEKVLHLGGKVVTMSDSSGFVHEPEGLNEEKLQFLIDLKTKARARISEYATRYNVAFMENEKPWKVPCDIALPCATQNELDENDARLLIENGCQLVAEGANMPSSNEAVSLFQKQKILFLPGKAANAGGVAVSGLEMSQNSLRLSWTRRELDQRLQDIMTDIHQQCVQYGQEKNNYVNYVNGANIAGFIKVADAILAYGVM